MSGSPDISTTLLSDHARSSRLAHSEEELGALAIVRANRLNSAGASPFK